MKSAAFYHNFVNDSSFIGVGQVTIHKPNTSRPANSERYIICKHKREGVENIRDYLLEINMRLNEIGLSLTGGTSSEVDVRDIVPEDIILDDEKFTEYMVESNNTLGERQVVALSKIAAFCKDPTLREFRQEEIKNQCLQFWQIPNEARKAPKHEPPTVLTSRLLGNLAKFDIFRNAHMRCSHTVLCFLLV